MSRSGYSYDIDDNWQLIMWRGRVALAIRGKRGQAMLCELLDALDAMPEKRLITDELAAHGEYCTLGVLGQKRGIDMEKIDPDEWDQVAEVFGIAPCMAQEVMFMNDEAGDRDETPERRWQRMRDWIASLIAEKTNEAAA